MAKLTGQQWKDLSRALQAAFPTYNFLQVFLQDEMGLSLAQISQPQAMPFVVYDVIQFTEAVNKTWELVEAARRNRPDNADLFALAGQAGTASISPALEKTLGTDNIVFDVAAFRRRAAEIENRVCRVDIKGKPAGTGFLIGPRAVITNYHVIKKVIDQAQGYAPEQITLLFDHKVLDDGTTIYPGTQHTLAQEWLIDASPFSQVDLQPEPKPSAPRVDELDYAVLRLDSAPANDSLGKVALPGYGTVRGHLTLPDADEVQDFTGNKVLFIMQHPKGGTLKLSANTFRSFNQATAAASTRLTYFNDTEHGSSGSPCLDGNWNLVALHHSGDPEFRPSYNEGIPMHKIVGLLGQRNKLDKVAT